MSNEVKEILPRLIDTLKTLSQSDEYSHFNSLNAEFDINEKDSSILENLSEKKDNCNKHLTNAIHHFEDCLFKLGYDLSDIETSDWEEGN